MKILSQTAKEETPNGKRRIALNIWGNWIGYAGRVRWMDFGCHANSEQDAKDWVAEQK